MEGGGRGRRRAGRTVSSSWYCFSSTRPMTPRLPHSSGVRGLWVLGPEASPRLALPSRAACTFPFTSCGRASVGRRGMHSLSSLAFSSSSPPARKIDKRARNEGRTEGKREKRYEDEMHKAQSRASRGPRQCIIPHWRVFLSL